MALITLAGLEFYAYHGLYEKEQQEGNSFLVDVEITADLQKASDTDNIEDTIDYETIYATVAKEMSIKSKLLEHVGQRISKSILEAFPHINHLKITVTKKNPPIDGVCKYAKVTITTP